MTIRDDSFQGADAPEPPDGAITRDQIASIQRGRIVRAVVEVVSERGCEHTSVERVCRQAGVSRATFYEQFDNRDGALLAAYEWSLARARSRVREGASRGEDWRGSMREGLAALLSLLDHEPALARLLIVEVPGSESAVLARRSEVAIELEKLIDIGRGVKGSAEDPPQTAAAGTVGAVLFVIHRRIAEQSPDPLTDLLGQLMSLIVLPYLGAEAAREELLGPTPEPLNEQPVAAGAGESVGDLGLRLTYRTIRCLAFLLEHPSSSSREVAEGAGVVDQGQMSKLLRRLEGLGLIKDGSAGGRGSRRSWALSARGERIIDAIKADSVRWSH